MFNLQFDIILYYDTIILVYEASIHKDWRGWKEPQGTEMLWFFSFLYTIFTKNFKTKENRPLLVKLTTAEGRLFFSYIFYVLGTRAV